MSVFTKEHIELLRQYVLSDEEAIKLELLESFPSDLREKVKLVQQGFENGSEAKSLAEEIGASDFETEIEEIQSAYHLRKLGLDEKDFEKEIRSSITSLERESLKKKLIAFEANQGEEPSDLELKSAITQIEREFIKKKFQEIEDSRDEADIPIYPLDMPGADLESPIRPAAYPYLSENRPFHSFLKYAVAACLLVAIGIGVYQFTKQDSVPENIVASSSEEKEESEVKKPIDLPTIQTVPLAEVATASNSYPVLKSGLGYGKVDEKVTVVVNNQQERISSIERAISNYSSQLDRLKEIQHPEAEPLVSDLRNRISALKEELTQMNTKERHYVFDGKVLNLFISSVQTKTQLVAFGTDIYLKTNDKFFKLTITEELKPLQEETDPNVLKALEKIIFNAE